MLRISTHLVCVKLVYKNDIKYVEISYVWVGEVDGCAGQMLQMHVIAYISSGYTIIFEPVYFLIFLLSKALKVPFSFISVSL